MAESVGKTPALPRGPVAKARDDDGKPAPDMSPPQQTHDRVDHPPRRKRRKRTGTPTPRVAAPIPRPAPRAAIPTPRPAPRKTIIPTPRPAPRRELTTTPQTEPRREPVAGNPLSRFVPGGGDSPDATTLPRATAAAPVKTTIGLAPTRKATIAVDIGSVIGSIADGTASFHLNANKAGKIGPLAIQDGLNVDGRVSITSGTLSGGDVRFSDLRGGAVTMPVAGPLAGVRGLVIRDHQIQAQTKVLGINFVNINATSHVFEGHSTIPVDPRALVDAIGLRSVPLAGPGSDRPLPAAASGALDIFRLEDATIRADVELAPSNGELVNFGEGAAMSIRPGSKVHLERASGRNVYDLQLNVDSSRFGKADGANVETGPAKLHVIAEQTIVGGRQHWNVRLVSASAIENVRVNVPLAGSNGVNHFELGNIQALAGGNRPIVSLDGNQLRVNVDGKLERMQGSLNLRDTRGHEAQLELGTNGAPTSVATHIELTTDITAGKPPQHVKVTGDTEGLHVAVRAPSGVQLASGEGVSFGVGEGTQLSGGGAFTYEQTAGGIANFAIASPNGISADVVLHDTSISRRLGEIGVRASLVNGSRMAAKVRTIDWASGVSDFSIAVDAKIDKARITLPSGENALVSHANATAVMDIRSSGRDTPPVVHGVLNVETVSTQADAAGGVSTGIEFLPNSVAGFDQPGVGGVRARVDEGKVKLTLPFTIDANGVRSENGELKHATLEGNGLSVATSFDTDKVASGAVQLAPLAGPGALAAAEVRHNQRIAAIDHDTIPALQPLSAAPPTTAVDLRGINAPAMLGGALQDIDLELMTKTTKEHNVRVYEGVGSDSSWSAVRWVGRTLGVAHADLTVQANTTIRLIVESESGEVSNQGAQRPGGAANPTKGKPSGLTFDPPVVLRIDGSRNNDSWLDGMQSGNIEIKAMNIVAVPGHPGKIRLEPVLGNTYNLEGHIMRAFNLDTTVVNEVGKQMLQAMTGSPEAPQNTAQLAQMIAGTTKLQLGAAASIGSADEARSKALARVPEASRGFVAEALGNMRFAARGSLRNDAVVRFGGNDVLTVKSGNTLSVTNARGGIDISGDVSLGTTRMNNGQAQLALASARAHLALSTRGGTTTLALTDMNADALDVRAQFPKGRIAVTNGSLRQGDLTITATGGNVAYSGNLDDLSAAKLELTQANGSYVRVTGASNGSLARVARLSFLPTGTVSMQGLSGRIAANGAIGDSRFYIERADVSGGSLNLSPNGGLTTSPLSLRNVRMAVTNVRVPPGDSTPGAIAASIRWLDARAGEATLTVTPNDGYALTTPKGKPADIVVSSDSATFRLPSPQAIVNVSDAFASGHLNSLRISPDSKRETIDISDWYMTGSARGSIVAGPPDSQASKLRIAPGSKVQLYVDRLGFAHADRSQSVAAVAQGVITGNFELPPARDDADVRAGGRATGSFAFDASTSGNDMSIRTRATIATINVEADLRARIDEVKSKATRAVKDVQTMFREAGPQLPPNREPATKGPIPQSAPRDPAHQGQTIRPAIPIPTPRPRR